MKIKKNIKKKNSSAKKPSVREKLRQAALNRSKNKMMN
jgi:hypothetical protein